MSTEHEDSEMRSEYAPIELGKGTRGKYYGAFTDSHNIVVLDPEVAEAFPTDKAVNDALRSLIDIANRSAGHVDEQE